MNEKKAKAIRRAVYGDMADVREYKLRSPWHRQIVATGLRRLYQQAKRELKHA